jgi:RNA polymerase sigma factor
VVIHFGDRGYSVPDDIVLKAQTGDNDCREFLLQTYQPYIIRITSHACHRFVSEGVDEEISFALMAFNEAIDSFRPGQGSRFLSFARLVVERRLTDYFRRTKPRFQEIPFSGFGDGDQDELYLLERNAAEQVYIDSEAKRDRQEEIVYLTELLQEFNISLDELVKISPKHAKARKRAMQAALAIFNNERWLQFFQKYKELPLKELDGQLPVSRKTLERQRKYIIALLIVYIEDLPNIREYLKGDDGL